MDLKNIPYKRHAYLGRSRSEVRKGALLTLLYDIPYFGACGIFPPLHILNQILLSGGGDGGMSPSASWKPFSISEAEYATLVDSVAAYDTTYFYRVSVPGLAAGGFSSS